MKDCYVLPCLGVELYEKQWIFRGGEDQDGRILELGSFR